MSDVVRLLASFLLALNLSVATPLAAHAQKSSASAKKGKPTQPQMATTAEQAPEPITDEEQAEAEAESAEEELAPAAVTLDVSKDSPLIQALYRATRETKEPAILDLIAQAQKLVDGGADLKALDPQGRTALHWGRP